MIDSWTFQVIRRSDYMTLSEGGPCPYEVCMAAIRLSVSLSSTQRLPDGRCKYVVNGQPVVIEFTNAEIPFGMTETGDQVPPDWATCQ